MLSKTFKFFHGKTETIAGEETRKQIFYVFFSPKSSHFQLCIDLIESVHMWALNCCFLFLAGSILAVSTADSHASGKKSTFVGICIQRSGKGLGATFRLRNIIEGQGGYTVECMPFDFQFMDRGSHWNPATGFIFSLEALIMCDNHNSALTPNYFLAESILLIRGYGTCVLIQIMCLSTHKLVPLRSVGLPFRQEKNCNNPISTGFKISWSA